MIYFDRINIYFTNSDDIIHYNCELCVKKIKKFVDRAMPGPRERVNGGWDRRSYPGAAPACSENSCSLCSPGERESGFWPSSGR